MPSTILTYLSAGLYAGIGLLLGQPAQPSTPKQTAPKAVASSVPAAPLNAAQAQPTGTTQDNAKVGSASPPASTTPSTTPSSRVKGAWQPATAPPNSARFLATVLPCGLRVLVGQDASLPVAAAVLSVPSGSGDDPGPNPGLLHALAYAMQMGNRELSPGAALDEVYDSGGFAEMAVGVGQIRFESLIPEWSLRGVLRVEADRFSTPTLSQPIWLKALQYAAQDRRPAHAPHLPMRAVAFEQPALLHDGRVVVPTLGEIPLPALSRYQSQHFRYARSTLAVVGPKPPAQSLALIRAVFDKVEPSPRAPAKAPPAISATPFPGQSTDNKRWHLRALPYDPQNQVLARVLCEQLSKRGSADAQGQVLPNLTCDLYPSPTHPFLQIKSSASSQEDLEARLASIASGKEDQSLVAVASRIQGETSARLSGALALARHLASLPEWTLSSQTQGLDEPSVLGVLSAGPAKLPDAAALRKALTEAGLLNPRSFRTANATRPNPPKPSE